MTTLAVLQPGFMPWLGFFDQIDRADVFVLYDDVQFDKNGWRNRNRIKGPQGPQWITVPVLHKGRIGQRILEVEIDNKGPWATKMIRSLRQCYAKAPYAERYLPELCDLLATDWRKLVDLDVALIFALCRWLGLSTRIELASALGVPGDRNRRLLGLCAHFGATRYLTGDAARDYLEEPAFRGEGIAVEWQNYDHPSYPQLHGGFISHLSAVDLLLNVGDESLSIIRRGRPLPADQEGQEDKKRK